MAKIYATKDTTIGFIECFMISNNSAAKRMFGDVANNPQSIINKHPEDYELYAVAKFDEDTGITKGLEKPELVARARDLMKVSE